MTRILSLVAVCCVCSLSACTTSKTSSVAPGAVSACGADCASACCASGKSSASPGAVSDSKSKSSCCPFANKSSDDVSPGAVGETKAECIIKSGCSKSKTTETVSPGAVSETKRSGCCSGAKKSATSIDG